MENKKSKCSLAYQEVQDTGKLNSDNYTMADFFDIEGNDIFKKTIPHYHWIQDYKEKGYYTYQRQLLSPCGNRVIIQDESTGKEKEMIMMASNNYLGLINHPRIIEAGINAYEKYGSGASSAPLLSGTFDITKELEAKLSEFKGCEDALVFSTGYSANIGTISALLRKGDVAIIDKLDHASIVDGCRFSGADIKVFRHQDMNRLEKCLSMCKDKYRGKLVIIDGVYGMDGDICPLPIIKDIASSYDAKIMLDDAHATGVIGKSGRGTTEHFNMEGEVDLVLGTFSKALAGVGGFVASTKEVINYLRFYSKSYFFSAALPPSVCASVKTAIEIIEDEPERINDLHDNVKYMHNRLKETGLRVTPPGTGAISVVIGDDLLLRKMSQKIHKKGLYINPLPYPSTEKNQVRFKFSLMATHTQADLDEAADIFEEVCREFDLIDKIYAASTVY